jgi:Mrp family chromosome partitioning ATPase
VVILDTPPLLAVADPALIARLCDAALLVVRAGATKAGALREAMNQLTQSEVSVVGLVFNRVSMASNGYYYRYHYYYQDSPDKP